MTKEDLRRDINFKNICSSFATTDFELYGDVIKLNSKKEGIYVLLDEHYNIIGVYNDGLDFDVKSHEEKDLKIFIEQKKHREVFSLVAPFENFSLKDIQELGKRIEIIPSNHGNFTEMLINGVIIDRSLEDDYSKECFYFLTYISFLGSLVQGYFKEDYHLKSLGLEYPNIYTYLNGIIQSIEQCVETLDHFSIRDISEYLGKTDIEFINNYGRELHEIINWCSSNSKEKEKLKENSLMFLKILEISAEEDSKNYKDINNHSYGIKLSQMFPPSSSYVLEKKNN